MKKIKLYLTHEEWRTVIEALNDLRNKRLAEGKCIDTVNETLLKVMNAKTKRMKVAG
jgi:beta-galactosidase beta subunit